MRKRLLRLLVLLVVAALLGVGGFFIAMRRAPLTPEQTLALQRLEAPTPPVQGKDASDLLWVIDRDVPEDRRHEVATRIRAYESGQRASGATMRDPRLDWPAFPAPPKQAGQGLCLRGLPGCLAYVAENRSLVAATLAANGGALALQRQIADFDGYRRGFPVDLREGVPNLGQFRSLRTSELALRFESGEQLSAVEGACHDISGWRRVGGNSDDTLVSMIGVAWVQEDLVLLADMLAKLPKDTVLPDECATALASSRDYEYDLCPTARSEFGLYRRIEQINAQKEDGRSLPGWLVDWPHLNARIAADQGRLCDPRLVAKLRADALAASLLPPAPACGKWQRRADPVGCKLYETLRSQIRIGYLDRRSDQAQMLALMRTVDWLRAQADSKEAVAEALSRRPESLGLLREPAYDFENDRLSIPLHDATRQSGARFELAAGAEPRPHGRQHRSICCTRPRVSRNLAIAD